MINDLDVSDPGELSDLVAHPTRIGVIGPPGLVEKVRQVARENPTVAVVCRAYQDEAEAPKLCRALEHEVEVVCFTGPIPYFYTVEQGYPEVPITHISLTGSSLYRVLLNLLPHQDITRLTVDTLSHTQVADAYEELGLPLDGIRTFEYRASVDRAALVQFHLQHYRQGKSTAALTCLRSAYDQLVHLGVPVHWVTPTKTAIRETLERAHFLGQSNRTKELQMVVGLVSLDRFDRVGGTGLSELDVQQVRLDFHRALLSEVEQVNGYLTGYGGAEYVFFTTPAAFERWSDGLRSLPLLGMVHRSLRTTVSLGIGFGLTAAQAGTHARIALKRAQADGGDCGYMLLGNRRLIGPIRPGHPAGEGAPLSYDLRTIDPETLRKVEAAGISAESLGRMAALVKENRLALFSAQDLAPLLGVTLRTVHRNLTKLEQLGIVQVVGEETLTRLGRPRRIYQFHLDGEVST